MTVKVKYKGAYRDTVLSFKHNSLYVAVQMALKLGGAYVGASNATIDGGLWVHDNVAVTGLATIIGEQTYHIQSTDGSLSQISTPATLTAGRGYRFQFTTEQLLVGTQLQVGDVLVPASPGLKTVYLAAEDTSAVIKRPYVASVGEPVDVIVKNVSIADVTDLAITVMTQPASASAVVGAASVYAVGTTSPFSVFYQWESSTDAVNWVAVGGATTATYTTPATTLGDHGKQYRCRIRFGKSTNATGQVYSAVAIQEVTELNSNPVSPGDLILSAVVGSSLTITEEAILTGVTDPESDPVTVTSLLKTSGVGTLSGSGPWLFDSMVEGGAMLTAVISDGRGGVASRTINLTVTTGVVADVVFTLIPTVTGTLDTSKVNGDSLSLDLAISGTVEQGSTCTLTTVDGTFGGGVPERFIFEDYTNVLVDGSVSAAARLGAWDSEGSSFYPLPNYVSGGMHGRPALPLYDARQTHKKAWRGLIQSSTFNVVFVGMAVRVPEGYCVGGEASQWPGGVPTPRGWSFDSWWKPWWLGIDEDDNIIDFIMPTVNGSQASYGGNQNSDTAPNYIMLSELWDWDGWNHMRGYLRHNPVDYTQGWSTHHWASAVNRAHVSARTHILDNRSDAPNWNSISFGRWTMPNDQYVMLAGYAYVAIGANAPCRVELTDHPVYLKGRKLAICPLLSHAAKAVDFYANLGEQLTSKPIFAHYFDENNICGPVGLLVNPGGNW